LLSIPEATLTQNSNPAPFVDNQGANRAIRIEILEIHNQIRALVNPLNDHVLNLWIERWIELEKRFQP
jgi:hypothetical protein